MVAVLYFVTVLMEVLSFFTFFSSYILRKKYFAVFYCNLVSVVGFVIFWFIIYIFICINFRGELMLLKCLYPCENTR
jgi:hypothetical protein